MARIKKKTLKQVYQVAVDVPVNLRKQTLSALNLKSEQSFYDILKGDRPLNDAEKKAVAEIFGVQVNDIIWPGVRLLAE